MPQQHHRCAQFSRLRASGSCGPFCLFSSPLLSLSIPVFFHLPHAHLQNSSSQQTRKTTPRIATQRERASLGPSLEERPCRLPFSSFLFAPLSSSRRVPEIDSPASLAPSVCRAQEQKRRNTRVALPFCNACFLKESPLPTSCPSRDVYPFFLSTVKKNSAESSRDTPSPRFFRLDRNLSCTPLLRSPALAEASAPNAHERRETTPTFSCSSQRSQSIPLSAHFASCFCLATVARNHSSISSIF